jgi:hypothetical protein
MHGLHYEKTTTTTTTTQFLGPLQAIGRHRPQLAHLCSLTCRGDQHPPVRVSYLAWRAVWPNPPGRGPKCKFLAPACVCVCALGEPACVCCALWVGPGDVCGTLSLARTVRGLCLQPRGLTFLVLDGLPPGPRVRVECREMPPWPCHPSSGALSSWSCGVRPRARGLPVYSRAR